MVGRGVAMPGWRRLLHAELLDEAVDAPEVAEHLHHLHVLVVLVDDVLKTDEVRDLVGGFSPVATAQ